MAKKRPTSVLVLAILHLLGGTLGLLLTTCSGLGLVVQANRAAARPAAQAGPPPAPESAGELGAALQAYIQDKVPGVQAVNVASVGASLVFDLMLLAGGVGLLLMQPWARVLSLVYALLSIAQKLFYLAYQLALVYPVMNEFLGQAAQHSKGRTTSAFLTGAQFGYFGALFFAFILIAYPITVLIILFQPSVAAAFHEDVPESLPPEDYDADLTEPDRPPPSDAFTG